jgi:hypothetical protein
MKPLNPRRVYLGAGLAAFTLLACVLDSRVMLADTPRGSSNEAGATGTYSSSAGSDAQRWLASLAGCVVLGLAAFPRHRAISTFPRSTQP